ncbi:alpha-L-fucosidase [Paenibacillus sacheonensis]|uniref:Endo-alpha(1,4)-fucoidanase Mef1 domain-containing protein n=1 Tax=Paenibacillus sacheonensis TaxID=742054 RepID=A0A7X4YQ64_9BACL|nr:alpha-L-fucosidase [Paenibacillus sacheonensis]MBM7566243.1 hypothetical protein [Paenibacillus sacheonensis]NBC70450.1 hypothetical protein [Paenibacillus sacheonensis]
MSDKNRETDSVAVEVKGIPGKKEVLTASAAGSDIEDEEGGRSYQWLSAATSEGIYEPIAGARHATLPLSAKEVGRFVRCEISNSNSGETIAAGSSRAVGPIADAAGNPHADWLREGKYGISHHLLAEFMNRVAAEDKDKWQPHETWNEVIDGFDVEDYAAQVVETGAAFVILTLGQNSGYLLSPNKTYDRIAEVEPGERCSLRDLPMEIMDALIPKGIKVILYLPANPPSKAHKSPGDNAINKAFHYPVEIAPSQETQAAWQSVIQEWSDRYRDKLAGWWFDGMWFQQAYDDFSQSRNWYSLVHAAKSDCVSRIVAFNSGIGSDRLVNSPLEDYMAGETNEIGLLPHNGRHADAENGVQWFQWTFLGKFVTDLAGWGNTGLNWAPEEVIRWVEQATDRDGAIALDVNVNRYGKMDTKQLELLKALKRRVKPEEA